MDEIRVFDTVITQHLLPSSGNYCHEDLGNIGMKRVMAKWVKKLPRMQEIHSSKLPVVTGIYYPNNSRARHHRMSLSNRNQSTDLLCKSMDWFLYDRNLRHERVNYRWAYIFS